MSCAPGCIQVVGRLAWGGGHEWQAVDRDLRVRGLNQVVAVIALESCQIFPASLDANRSVHTICSWSTMSEFHFFTLKNLNSDFTNVISPNSDLEVQLVLFLGATRSRPWNPCAPCSHGTANGCSQRVELELWDGSARSQGHGCRACRDRGVSLIDTVMHSRHGPRVS